MGAAKHTVVRDAWCQVYSLTSRQHDLYHGSSLSISDHYHYPNQQLNYLISLTKCVHGTTIISVFYLRFLDLIESRRFTSDDNDNHDNEADNKKTTTKDNKREDKDHDDGSTDNKDKDKNYFDDRYNNEKDDDKN